MKKVKIETFNIIGIAVITTNENGQAGKDIGALWHTFTTEGIIEKIPNKIDNTVYAIYTDYESDHTKPYTTLLGCKVESLNEIPKGMTGKIMEGGNYTKFTAKGDISEGLLIYKTWENIWQIDLDRRYTADYEVYGDKAQDPTDAEIDILIAIH